MQILTVDIGTGTQDIFLYDSRLDIENGYKLVVPSPTLMVHRRIQEATRQGEHILLSGKMMGGGPSQWAAEGHVRNGFHVYATPQAAASFNDDLDLVQSMGITLLSEDEAQRLPSSIQHIEMCDFDFSIIRQAYEKFGVSLNHLAAVAVAVFDHGNAPPGYSDRQFRFDYLNERIRVANRLSTFAYLPEQIPSIMTRLQAVAESGMDVDAPLLVMDTAPAAVLGASFDPRVSRREQVIVANVGNLHTLAFRLGPQGIEGVFEHHTGLLDRGELEHLLRSLADASLTHEEVFGAHGHGALLYTRATLRFPEEDYGVAVTGPRRNMLRGSELRPYFAAPFGDMMITGCFGLLAAVADLLPETHDAIMKSLSGSGIDVLAPWDVGKLPD
ncbi:MAG: DUF1786 domain-containing protein [Anaerolineaceae bacterium]|nr:DUF1786 domain-containing protein [Anaerolineaceae bacterium]